MVGRTTSKPSIHNEPNVYQGPCAYSLTGTTLGGVDRTAEI